ncbi:tetratricopeptide repeat protein [Simkania sp.]|uniref:tetratricopeptide repeat protein n=1 Tax=Simkania sp. TaxID=34094 RepID=UPI003B52100D
MTANVNNNPNHLFPITYSVNLSETEPYTYETFEELQTQHFDKGKKFYICVLREGERNFIFDAISIATLRHRTQVLSEKSENPLTRASLGDYAIYESSSDDRTFRLFKTKTQMEKMFHVERLPLQWNCLSTDPDTQLQLMKRYAHEKANVGDLDDAKKTYHQIVELFEDVQAMLSLYNLYIADQPERAFFYLEKAIQKQPDLSAKNLFIYARNLIKRRRFDEALSQLEKAAEKGESRAIRMLTNCYEQGDLNTPLSEEKAKFWRSKLPRL